MLITFIAGLVIGLVAGALIGRANKKKLEKVIDGYKAAQTAVTSK